MGKKGTSEIAVRISFIPCDPEEWEEALDLLASMVAEAYLDGMLKNDLEETPVSQME